MKGFDTIGTEYVNCYIMVTCCGHGHGHGCVLLTSHSSFPLQAECGILRCIFSAITPYKKKSVQKANCFLPCISNSIAAFW